jgi:haloacetate dehalogenase
MLTSMPFFDGFALERIDTGEATIRVRHGGDGPPVVLLHGHPRTHTTWHAVAPLLAGRHTVVCPDLRGYGESSGPPTTPDHAPYSKRAMARDVVAVMRELGHERFAVAGHDRGSGVAQRLAVDAPEAVTRVAILDGLPFVEALERCDARFAASWWHWWFFGQTEKPAEEWICRDPDAWYADAGPQRMGAENHADYKRAIRDPATVHAMLEDYRAGLGIDREHEEADRAAGRRIGCPLLFACSIHDDMEELYGDPVAIWRDWADDVRGARIDSGHHMAEEAPEDVAAVLGEFLA